MSAATLCGICQKKKAKRYCPGVRKQICALCCGTEREVSVDCPFDCPYLRESRRYDFDKAERPASLPFPAVEVDDGFLAEHEQFVGVIGVHLLRSALANPQTTDKDLQGAIQSLVRTYESLVSG